MINEGYESIKYLEEQGGKLDDYAKTIERAITAIEMLRKFVEVMRKLGSDPKSINWKISEVKEVTIDNLKDVYGKVKDDVFNAMSYVVYKIFNVPIHQCRDLGYGDELFDQKYEWLIKLSNDLDNAKLDEGVKVLLETYGKKCVKDQNPCDLLNQLIEGRFTIGDFLELGRVYKHFSKLGMDADSCIRKLDVCDLKSAKDQMSNLEKALIDLVNISGLASLSIDDSNVNLSLIKDFLDRVRGFVDNVRSSLNHLRETKDECIDEALKLRDALQDELKGIMDRFKAVYTTLNDVINKIRPHYEDETYRIMNELSEIYHCLSYDKVIGQQPGLFDDLNRCIELLKDLDRIIYNVVTRNLSDSERELWERLIKVKSNMGDSLDVITLLREGHLREEEIGTLLNLCRKGLMTCKVIL